MSQIMIPLGLANSILQYLEIHLYESAQKYGQKDKHLQDAVTELSDTILNHMEENRILTQPTNNPSSPEYYTTCPRCGCKKPQDMQVWEVCSRCGGLLSK